MIIIKADIKFLAGVYMSSNDEVVKKMANLIRAGAQMLQESCPICRTPLVKLKSGEIICPKCERRVYIVKDELEERGLITRLTIQGIEETLTMKLGELNKMLKQTTDLDEMYDVLRVLIAILEAIERIRKISK